MLAREPAPLIVRPARAEDLERITRLEEAAFEDSWPRDLLD